MADVDLQQQLLAQQSLLQSSQGAGGKIAPVLAGILPGGGKDIDIGASLSVKGKGFNGDGMVNKLPQAKPGFLKDLLAKMGVTGPEILEGMKKVAQAGPVQQASLESITGPNISPTASGITAPSNDQGIG